MLSSLSFLIHGKSSKHHKKRKLKDLACFYLSNKHQPVRDCDGNPLTSEQLRNNLNHRIENLKITEFQPAVDIILDKLEERDEALYYFVLVATFRLPDLLFEDSLKKLAVEQKLMTRIEGNYKYRLLSEPVIQNEVPQLAWDITPVLYTDIIEAPDQPEPLTDLSNIRPVDEWGLFSIEYQQILKCEELRLSIKEGSPIVFFHLDTAEFWRILIDMYRGISSDVMQINGMNCFYQSKPCKVDPWNLSTTKTILNKHIYLANLLNEVRHHLQTNRTHGGDNSIRIMIQKYIHDEQFLFREFFEYLVNIEKKQPAFDSEFFPFLDFSQTSSSDKFEMSDKLYEIANSYHHVLQQMIGISKNINDFSPIVLNEMAFVGSKSAPHIYSKGMWRRLNVALTRYIVKKLAGMLSTPDAELFELLTDAGDVKLIRDPSVWQRLNPLKMEPSMCIDESLANRLVDLIIGYRFFVNDKKFQVFDKDKATFAKSDIRDGEELELYSKTPEFEQMLNESLAELDENKATENLDELTNCIEVLLSRLPTTSLVEEYSKVVLSDSVKFFEFLKRFFTSAYIHVYDKNITHKNTLASLDREKMHKFGYDVKFLATVGCDMKSTIDEYVFTVTPPEPLNVYVSESATSIYGKVFTIMGQLHSALDSVIETHNCETLRHEPRLRYALFHMNTTVSTIRKNILTLVEAAYENLMNSIDFTNSKNIGTSTQDCLNICYKAHRKFMRDVAGAIMLPLNRGSTGRIIKMMVASVIQSSKSCINGDAVSADKHYQQFLSNLILFLDQCRLDRTRYILYQSLEIGDDSTDGNTVHSSYSDDLSCRSY